MATFGYTGIAATAVLSDNDISGTQYVLAEAGIVTHIFAYVGLSGNNADNSTWVKCAIYNSSNVLLGQTAAISVVNVPARWVKFAMSSPLTLSPGTYWLTVFGAVDTDPLLLFFDTDASVVSGKQLEVGFPTFSDPFIPGADTDRKYSVYAEYQNNPVAWLTG